MWATVLRLVSTKKTLCQTYAYVGRSTNTSFFLFVGYSARQACVYFASGYSVLWVKARNTVEIY